MAFQFRAKGAAAHRILDKKDRGSFAPKRTIFFAAWGAEQAGPLGSDYYAAEDPQVSAG
ncbi:MAG: M28 family peptidase [Desulfobacterales bacterium]|nr:MAG: M28 family peptidase [Desulfobacterales bacterium]